MTDWFKVAQNLSSNTGAYKAIIEMLLDENCTEFTREFAKEKFKETKALDIYEGA